MMTHARSTITDGHYAGTDLTPQEYLLREVGPDRFRSLFADWAAHNTADMDYMTREQWRRAQQEITISGHY